MREARLHGSDIYRDIDRCPHLICIRLEQSNVERLIVGVGTEAAATVTKELVFFSIL